MTNDEAEKNRERRKQETAELNACYLRTFDTEHGKAVLSHLHKTAGTNRSSFWPGSNGQGMDSIAAAKRDGAKTIVWLIEEILESARNGGNNPAATDKLKAVSRPRSRAQRQG